MKSKIETLYEDKLVEIRDDSLTLKNYYFPSMSPKRIPFDEIERIEIKQASFLTGKWRIHGTGDFQDMVPVRFFAPQKGQNIFHLL